MKFTIKKLPEICEIKTGKRDANHATQNGKYRFYTCANQYSFCDTFSFSGKSVIVPGNGDIGLVFYYDGEFEAYQRTYVLQNISIDAKYLYYHLLYKWRHINSGKQYGSTVRYVRISNFTSYTIPVPSEDEQKRIVAKIEELFSELDNGVETLKKTKQQLAVYRQAVLKEAFEGRYSNSTPIKNIKINDFSDVGTGATPLTTNPKYYGGNIPWVTSSKINDEKIYEPSDYITELAISETNCKVYPPHTLLVAMYGEGKTRGKCAELMISAATNQALAAIELQPNSVVLRDYLKWYLVFNYQEIRRKASGGVQPNLNLGIVKNLNIPLFTKDEQKIIVQEIEARLSVCDSIEKTVDTALQQAEAMRQSILKKAFEGEL